MLRVLECNVQKGRFWGCEVVRKKTKHKLKIFDRQEYISSLDDNNLSIKEQAKIRRIETLEQCEGLIRRWKNSPNNHFIRVLQLLAPVEN